MECMGHGCLYGPPFEKHLGVLASLGFIRAAISSALGSDLGAS